MPLIPASVSETLIPPSDLNSYEFCNCSRSIGILACAPHSGERQRDANLSQRPEQLEDLNRTLGNGIQERLTVSFGQNPVIKHHHNSGIAFGSD